MNAGISSRIAVVSFLLTCVSSFPVRGAYLDKTGNTGELAPAKQPPEHLVVFTPLLLPTDDSALRRLLRQVEVGRPYGYGRMIVFPLEMRNASERQEIRTLDEALRHDWITIRELDQARVAALSVRNESSHALFLMAGEILGGGRQDRIVRRDVLLRPESDAVIVPVYCGEQDRWKGDRDSFDRAPHVAGQTLRGMAARESSQEAIWTEIDARLKQSGAKAPTRNYQSLYADAEASRRIDGRVERFRGIRNRRTVGLVVVQFGQAVGADLFGDPDLCAALWEKILRAHVADDAREDDWREKREIAYTAAGATVKRFLEDLSSAGQSREETPGAGDSFAIRGRMADGHALEWNGSLVHAAAFSKALSADEVKSLYNVQK